jgi:outer membrane receptor protein involved in Fe transport
MLRITLLASSAGLVATAWSAPALAQGAPAAEGDESAAIVVTGSRIARRDYTATSPIVTVDADVIEKSASVSLEANLNKLPQFAPALTQFGPPTDQLRNNVEASAFNTPGATSISLRQLGPNRNVVLLDGRRQTPVNGTGVVDLNAIPSAAVERVEVITGGASSTYGADAVAGVTNFILKKNFQGFSVDGQIGVTQAGDGQEYRLTSLIGASIDGGRGNVMIGMERYDRSDVRQFARKAYRDLYTDPNTLGNTIFGFEQTYFLFPTFSAPAGQTAISGTVNQTTLNTMFRAKGAPSTDPTGANLNVSSAFGIYLNNDGTLFLNQGQGTGAAFTPLLAGYTGQVDGVDRKKTAVGLLRDNYSDQLLSTPQTRWSFFARGHYEINDWVSAFSQVNFVKSQVFTRNLVPPAITTWSVLIPHGTDIFRGDQTLSTTPYGTPLVGAYNYGIPSSINADGSTNVDFLAAGRLNSANQVGTGKFGLNCSVNANGSGGCSNSQVYPVSSELNTLLNSRPGQGANTPFQLNYFLKEIGDRYLDNRNTTFQMMAGFDGKIPGTDWTWELYASHGETVAKADQYNFASVLRWRAVAQAPNFGYGWTFKGNAGPPGGGFGVVTGPGFQGAAASCASGVNPFVAHTWTQDCKDAVTTNLQTENKNVQDIAELNIQGGLFKLPYGQVRFALGASYRYNLLDYHPDGSTTEGTSFLEVTNGVYPQGATKGSIKAKEVYGELLIPLLSNLPLAHLLNIELGYRTSNYSVASVGTVPTWKINAEYAPVDWLRFRGGFQKASRAPNLAELYSAITATLGSSADGDPCSRANSVNPAGFGNYSANPIGLNSELQAAPTDTFGNADAPKVEALCRQMMGADGAAVFYAPGAVYSTSASLAFPQLKGNANLTPEKATTYTIGAVISSPIQSPWLRRFNLSVDYYNIKLSNAISQQSVDGVQRRCFSKLYNPNYTLNEFCALVGRNPSTGGQDSVKTIYTNSGRVETSGVDAQMNWGLDFRDAGIGLPGRISISSTFTYLISFKTSTDYTFVNGQPIIPLYEWSGTTGPTTTLAVGTNSGAYRWKMFNTYTYAVGPVSVTLQWQHKPAARNADLVVNSASRLTGAPAYDLFNLNGTIAVMKNATLRYGIDNLFNKQPPLIGRNLANVGNPGGQLIGGTYDPTQYDVLGRRFYIGANFKL